MCVDEIQFVVEVSKDDRQERSYEKEEKDKCKFTGNKEVCCSLTIGGLEAHVDEVLTGRGSRPKIGHAAIVYDADFVEVIIELFTCRVTMDETRNWEARKAHEDIPA